MRRWSTPMTRVEHERNIIHNLVSVSGLAFGVFLQYYIKSNYTGRIKTPRFVGGGTNGIAFP